jgi:predicted metal-binding protein
MRKRRGFFDRYAKEKELHLIGIINCAGCPTIAAPEKILQRVNALAGYKLDALHFSYCMTALCPFIKKYQKVIIQAFPDLEIVFGTHLPKDNKDFRQGVKELLCPTVHKAQDMNDLIKGTLKTK